MRVDPHPLFVVALALFRIWVSGQRLALGFGPWPLPIVVAAFALRAHTRMPHQTARSTGNKAGRTRSQTVARAPGQEAQERGRDKVGCGESSEWRGEDGGVVCRGMSYHYSSVGHLDPRSEIACPVLPALNVTSPCTAHSALRMRAEVLGALHARTAPCVRRRELLTPGSVRRGR